MLKKIKKIVRRMGPLYRTINRFRGIRIHEPRAEVVTSIVGSDYGGWGLDTSLLNESSIVYSVGVGEDISFDLGIVKLTGCEVYAFDPTPIAIDWISKQQLPSSIRFIPNGLGNEDGEVAFQAPPVPGFHSYSLTKSKDALQFGEVQCPIRRLPTLMAELGHSHLDVLKMDIEGFEYSVIEDLISTEIKPVQILVEFHHGLYAHTKEETSRAVDLLIRHGYTLFWVSDVGREYAFKLV